MKAGKHDFAQPILFGSIFAVLLLARVLWSVTKGRAAKPVAAG